MRSNNFVRDGDCGSVWLRLVAMTRSVRSWAQLSFQGSGLGGLNNQKVSCSEFTVLTLVYTLHSECTRILHMLLRIRFALE